MTLNVDMPMFAAIAALCDQGLDDFRLEAELTALGLPVDEMRGTVTALNVVKPWKQTIRVAWPPTETYTVYTLKGAFQWLKA